MSLRVRWRKKRTVPLRQLPGTVLAVFALTMFACAYIGDEIDTGYGLLAGTSGWAADSIVRLDRYTSTDWEGERAAHGLHAFRRESTGDASHWDWLPEALRERGLQPGPDAGVDEETIRRACIQVGQRYPSDTWGWVRIAEGVGHDGERVVAVWAQGPEIENDVRGVWEAVLRERGGYLRASELRRYDVHTDGVSLGLFLGFHLGALLGAVVAVFVANGSSGVAALIPPPPPVRTIVEDIR